MQAKTFKLLSFLLSFSTILFAENSTGTHPNPLSLQPLEWRCNAPAPASFGVEEISGTMARLTWSYVPEAAGGYRIEVTRDSDHQLICTHTKSQNELEVWITDLVENEHYTAEIRSICGDNQVSTLAKIGPVHTIIQELVINGYTPPIPNSPVCPITTSNGFCTFPTSDATYHFRVYKGNIERYLGVKTINNGQSLTYLVDIGYANDPTKSPISFYCQSELGAETSAGCAFAHILVKYNGVAVAKIEIFSYNGLSGSKLQCSIIEADWTVARVLASAKPGMQIVDRTDDSNTFLVASSEEFVQAVPNPFGENLDILLTQNTASKVHVALLSPDGKTLIREHYEADQSKFTLSTAGLRPGLYFLKVQSGDQIQTLKVVKSE